MLNIKKSIFAGLCFSTIICNIVFAAEHHYFQEDIEKDTMHCAIRIIEHFKADIANDDYIEFSDGAIGYKFELPGCDGIVKKFKMDPNNVTHVYIPATNSIRLITTPAEKDQDSYQLWFITKADIYGSHATQAIINILNKAYNNAI